MKQEQSKGDIQRSTKRMPLDRLEKLKLVVFEVFLLLTLAIAMVRVLAVESRTLFELLKSIWAH